MDQVRNWNDVGKGGQESGAQPPASQDSSRHV